MRFRDYVCIAIVTLLVALTSYFITDSVEDAMFASVEINREDSNRAATTVLSDDEWVEFQIQIGARSLRLLTNAALDAAEAPDHDLSNPRTGWRYAVDYEILDANRDLISKSRYHFRSQIRQLIDAETGETIYPIFFGKSSLVASQTRVMQLAINRDERRAAILRVKVASKDQEIQELVARVLSKCERVDFDSRSTWNRLARSHRDAMCKHCVYHHDLLSIEERNNLLRWKWWSAPVLTEIENRYMFFIGDMEDQEVRADYLPAGLFADQNWRGMIAVPEQPGTVRLQFQHIDPATEVSPASIGINWFGADASERKSLHHKSDVANSQVTIDVQGGLIEIMPSARVVVNAFWQPIDDAPEMAIPDGQVELDVTPEPSYVRTYLSDSRPFEYAVSHSDGKPTPIRIVLRYPYAPLFSNQGALISPDPISSDAIRNISYSPNPDAAVDTPTEQFHESASGEAVWDFINADGEVVESGTLSIAPEKSVYDRFTVASKMEPVSDPHEFFFAVPADVEKIRIRSSDSRLLVATYTRVPEMQRITRVPEDQHAFNRKESTRRSWFGLNPLGYEEMLQANRSFIVQSQTRPPQSNPDILAGQYRWQRYVPKGKWIGRQLLVPQVVESELTSHQVTESAIAVTFFELANGKEHAYRTHDSEVFQESTHPKLIFAADDSPGRIKVLVDGKLMYEKRVLSSRGQISLDEFELGHAGTMQVLAENPTRFFLAGKRVADAKRYVKRTAQRLKDGLLDFDYQKESTEDELLTLQLYRDADEQDRCQLRVSIDGPFDAAGNPIRRTYVATQENHSWTIRERLYDLRPQTDHGSVLLGRRENVDTGNRCYIRMGADLAPGKYRIQVERADGVSGGYVLLYQAIPGEKPTRSINLADAGGAK